MSICVCLCVYIYFLSLFVFVFVFEGTNCTEATAVDDGLRGVFTLDKMKAGADKKITHLKEFLVDSLKQLLFGD